MKIWDIVIGNKIEANLIPFDSDYLTVFNDEEFKNELEGFLERVYWRRITQRKLKQRDYDLFWGKKL